MGRDAGERVREGRNTMTTTATARLTGVVGAAVLLTSLAACSNDDDSASSAKSDRPSDTASATDQRISPTDLPTAPRLRNAKGAVKDVTVGECPTDKGENTVEGSVENSTGSAQDYVITISWVTSRSDVVARGIATVRDLPAGDKRSWKATGDIASAGTYSCTTQVLRGRLRGQ